MQIPDFKLERPYSSMPIGISVNSEFDIVSYLDKVNLSSILFKSSAYTKRGFDIELDSISSDNKFYKVTLYNKVDDENNLRKPIGMINGEIAEEEGFYKIISLVFEDHETSDKTFSFLKIVRSLDDEIILFETLDASIFRKYIIDFKLEGDESLIINIGDFPKNAFEHFCMKDLDKITTHIRNGNITLKEGLILIRTLYLNYFDSLLKKEKAGDLKYDIEKQTLALGKRYSLFYERR